MEGSLTHRFYQPYRRLIGSLQPSMFTRRPDEAATYVPWCPLASVKKRKV